MSSQSPPLPSQAHIAEQADDPKMPKGHCRYILLLPEIKGQRCACVGFALNKGIPGATCDCGHLACFHTKEQESTTDQKQELELLRRRIQQLEDHFSKGQEEVIDGVVARLNEVEEHVEKSREEFTDQIKGTYRNISLSWRSIEQVERKNQQHDEQLRQIYDKLGHHDQKIQRLQAAQMELQDADLSLEERIENLTETIEEQEEDYLVSARGFRPRRRSTSDTSRPNLPLGPLGVRGAPLDEYHRPRRSPPTTRPIAQGRGEGFASDGTLVPLFLKPLPASARSTGAWTVHISLLPHALVPMPFERNTNAYQRCLSRGLHQVVVVNGPDARSFTTAVEKAFGSILKGRPWMPLQAKLCDAETLQGLPMLRQLDPQLVEGPYDHEFLKTHVAVCDSGGMIDSLYIAMRRHTISWAMLKHGPVFTEGLENCWGYDALLDNDVYHTNVSAHEEQPPAGAITTFPVASLKRPLNEVSRSNSFGSASAPNIEGEGSRGPKRACPVSVPAATTSAGAGAGAIVEIRMRGVETA